MPSRSASCGPVSPGWACRISSSASTRPVDCDTGHSKCRAKSGRDPPGFDRSVVRMTNFILVPGMWLGAWAWDAVAEPLRAAGHDVTAVTLGGLAERADEAGSAGGVTLESHIDDVVAAAGDRAAVTLVAHSYGCFPVRGAVERLGDRVTRVVYVDSGPVPDGTAQADFSAPDPSRSDVPPPSFDP